MTKSVLLIRCLREPRSIASLNMRDWDLLVRQARKASLLSKLEWRFREASVWNDVPSVVKKHCRWASIATERHHESVVFEVSQLHEQLTSLGQPIILLKGAAYCLGCLAPARGRLFSDIDILLPKKSLPEAEKLLEKNGWLATHLDAYDQRYYRSWMHELPPLRHGKRQTELDVHHGILPETMRQPPNSQWLLDNSVPLDSMDNISRLNDEDLILHSAAHCFYDGEFHHGLRDLYDIHELIGQFSVKPEFWERLSNRAERLNLRDPLYFALLLSSSWFGTAVPDSLVKSLGETTGRLGLRGRFLSACFSRALLPAHTSTDDWFTPMARWLLFVRSHAVKMPIYLLLYHLLYKSVNPLVQGYKLKRKSGQRETIQTFLDKKSAEQT